MQLELNATQQWLVMQALSLLSTPQGVVHLQAQYPDLNVKQLGEELEELMLKFEPTETPKDDNGGTQR